jgi:hypothetical protein
VSGGRQERGQEPDTGTARAVDRVDRRMLERATLHSAHRSVGCHHVISDAQMKLRPPWSWHGSSCSSAQAWISSSSRSGRPPLSSLLLGPQARSNITVCATRLGAALPLASRPRPCMTQNSARTCSSPWALKQFDTSSRCDGGTAERAIHQLTAADSTRVNDCDARFGVNLPDLCDATRQEFVGPARREAGRSVHKCTDARPPVSRVGGWRSDPTCTRC